MAVRARACRLLDSKVKVTFGRSASQRVCLFSTGSFCCRRPRLLLSSSLASTSSYPPTSTPLAIAPPPTHHRRPFQAIEACLGAPDLSLIWVRFFLSASTFGHIHRRTSIPKLPCLPGSHIIYAFADPSHARRNPSLGSFPFTRRNVQK